MHVDPDGKVRLVIAHCDPGVVKGHNERRYGTPWIAPPGPRMREFVEAFAPPLPVICFLKMMGLPRDRQDQFVSWVYAVFRGESTEEQSAGFRAVEASGLTSRSPIPTPRWAVTCSGPCSVRESMGDASPKRKCCRRAFGEPLVVDFRRENVNTHLAFGAGPHTCPGSRLARVEIRVMIEDVLPRWRNLRVRPGSQIEYVSGGTLAIKALPLVWDVAQPPQ